MSVLKYGDGEGAVFLNVTEVKGYKREAVYQGPDYLYTRHTIHVRAVFNPGTDQSELFLKDNTWLDTPPHVLPAAPVVRKILGPVFSRPLPPHSKSPDYTRPACYTSEAVKSVLLQPRLRLQWAVDGQNILLSPLPGVVVDETNGPTPISCDVVEMLSGKTWLVDWIIRTDLNEASQFTAKPSPVLSHQYGQQHKIGMDFLTTVVTRGTVVFSPSVLKSRNVAGQGTFDPDDLRDDLFLPVPANMKRQEITTSVSADGLTVQYEVTDSELPLNWDRAGITRVVGIHACVNELPNLSVDTKVFGKVSVVDLAARGNALGGRALKGALEAAPGFKDLPDWLKVALEGTLNVALAPFGIGNPAGFALGQGWGGILAKSNHVVKVQAWVHRDADRNAAEDFIRDIVQQRVRPAINNGLPLITVKSAVQHSIEGNTVECEEHYVGGPLGPIGSVLPTKVIGNGVRIFGVDNDTGDLIVKDSTRRVEAPPNGSRGTHTEAMVSSALSRPSDPTANLPPKAPTQPAPELLNVPQPPTWPKPTI